MTHQKRSRNQVNIQKISPQDRGSLWWTYGFERGQFQVENEKTQRTEQTQQSAQTQFEKGGPVTEETHSSRTVLDLAMTVWPDKNNQMTSLNDDKSGK